MANISPDLGGFNMDYIHGIESDYGRNPKAMKPNKAKALGPYQITPIAWKDLQQQYPERYGKANYAQTVLDPMASRWAAWDMTRLNARYLKNLGVPVTEENLAAAYNMGAGGVHAAGANINNYPAETQKYIQKYRALKANGVKTQAIKGGK